MSLTSIVAVGPPFDTRTRHPAALRGEFESVGDQVVDQLAEALAVAGRADRLGFDVEEHALLVGLWARRVDCFGGDLLEVQHRLAVGGHAAGLDLGDEEQVADKPVEAPGIAIDDVEVVALVFVDLTGVPGRDDLQVAGDRSQRGAQLVRDEGEELILQPVRFLASCRSLHHLADQVGDRAQTQPAVPVGLAGSLEPRR